MANSKNVEPSSQLSGVRYEIRGSLARRAHELERQGYEVGDLETARGFFEVDASIDGERYEIRVDPETGLVAKIERDN